MKNFVLAIIVMSLMCSCLRTAKVEEIFLRENYSIHFVTFINRNSDKYHGLHLDINDNVIKYKWKDNRNHVNLYFDENYIDRQGEVNVDEFELEQLMSLLIKIDTQEVNVSEMSTEITLLSKHAVKRMILTDYDIFKELYTFLQRDLLKTKL